MSKNTPALVAEDVTPATIEELRAAVAAVDATGEADNIASHSLAEAVRSRYAMHATTHATTLDGIVILPDDMRREVAALVWLDAVGLVNPPSSKDRTPGQRSVGQYVARFGTVATDAAHGVACLASTSQAADSYRLIGEARKLAKEEEAAGEARALIHAAHASFVAWFGTLPQPDRDAFDRVTRVLTGPKGREHLEAFVLDLQTFVA